MQGEFRGDFTRDTANRSKQFLRVLMQQGRVQVDADWNEQVDVLLHYLQSLAATLIGPYGGVADPQANFEVIATTDAGDSIIDAHNFVIGAGQYYVDGILCELETLEVSIADDNLRNGLATIVLPGWFKDHPAFQVDQYLAVLFQERDGTDDRLLHAQITDQNSNTQGQLELELSFFPQAPNVGEVTNVRIRPLTTYVTQPYLSDLDSIAAGDHLVYLDVWERHVSHLEDRSELVPGIREVALGGVDTATRSQVVWQVKLLPFEGQINDDTNEGSVQTIKGFDDFRDILTTVRDGPPEPEFNILKPGTGQLMARARKPEVGATDPCIISPESRYRGPENQLYRVEVFSIIEGQPQFVWSRDNSAVTFPIVGSPNPTNEFVVTVEHLGRDQRFSLTKDDLVEIVDGVAARPDRTRVLYKVSQLDLDENRVTLTALTTNQATTPAFGPNALLRRWDCAALQPIEVPNAQGGWISLENGVEIKFQFGDRNEYRVDDYWLIPARTETGDVEWPGTHEHPWPRVPHGVSHHYAPLAIISVNSDGKVTTVRDCRRFLNRLAS